MEVHAVCMGRIIGEYIVTRVGKRNAIMEVKADSEDSRLIYVKRGVGAQGAITVLRGGVNIQATDYFVQPYVRRS